MMKRILYIFLLTVSVFAVNIVAGAQNLDPTVEVTRAYSIDEIKVNKPLIEMAVPDTVTKFNIYFDYSVSDNPYQGSYRFEPYTLSILPEFSEFKDKSFLLRLGAGYSLHPTLDFVYSPRIKSNSFAMSIYATHRSYFGKYRAVSLDGVSVGEDGVYGLNPGIGKAGLDWDGKSKSRYSGYDTFTNAGIYGRADWDKGFFTFDIGYTGYALKDTSLRRNFDTLWAELRVASKTRAQNHFIYDLALSYMYGSDNVRPRVSPSPVFGASDKARLQEHDFTLKGALGQAYSLYSKFAVDIDVEFTKYNSYFDSYAGVFSLTPKYVFRKNRWLVNLGVNISTLIKSDGTVQENVLDYQWASMHSTKGQYFYPDVELGFDIIKNHWNIYVKADGGENINRYSSMVAKNPFLSLNYAMNYAGLPLFDNTVERYNARLGFKGNIGSRFSFDIRGGYVDYKNAMMDAVLVYGDGSEAVMAPTLNYSGYGCWYGAFDFGWQSKDVTINGSVTYRNANIIKKQLIGFEPATIAGNIDIIYNWHKRIYVGVHANASTYRRGYAGISVTETVEPTEPVEPSDEIDGGTKSYYTAGFLTQIPGYIDLGLSFEYRFARTLSFWIYGGNLLNYTIQYSPLHTLSGISGTLGITLAF